MSTLHTTPSKQRFAWLTPLQAQKTSCGPWMLCENRTHHLQETEKNTVSVSINALLRLLAASFAQKGDEPTGNLSVMGSFKSDCQRYEIRRQQLNQDNSRLFVQQKTDYFQRLELLVDNQLVTAFHEPVWPHLQTPHALSHANLHLPADCMEFLEQQAALANELHCSIDSSSNQASHSSGKDQAAA